jgi:hypothetical protein
MGTFGMGFRKGPSTESSSKSSTTEGQAGKFGEMAERLKAADR